MIDQFQTERLQELEIVHQFKFSIPGKNDERLFVDAGIELEGGDWQARAGGPTGFVMGESDPRWWDARRLGGRFRATETVWTRFSDEERDSADYLGIVPRKPERDPDSWCAPSSVAGIFDLSKRCVRCGIGRRQVRPFQLRDVPDLTNQIANLHWVTDEYLVGYETWATVFQRLGVRARQVVMEGSGEVVQSVVQLDISEQASLTKEPATGTICGLCGRRKSVLSLEGFFPDPVYTEAGMFRSKQYFGSETGPYNLIFVSRLLYRMMKAAPLRGVDYYPCGITSDNWKLATAS